MFPMAGRMSSASNFRASDNSTDDSDSDVSRQQAVSKLAASTSDHRTATAANKSYEESGASPRTVRGRTGPSGPSGFGRKRVSSTTEMNESQAIALTDYSSGSPKSESYFPPDEQGARPRVPPSRYPIDDDDRKTQRENPFQKPDL